MRCIVFVFLDFWDFFQFLPHWMLSLSHVMVSSLCLLACSNTAQPPQKNDYETFTMVSVPADNIHFDNAVSATQGLFLRDLPAHVCVGPMPPGALLATDLPLNDLNVSSPNIKHFLDLVLDIPKSTIDVPSLQAIFRDQAWEELPEVMKLKIRPTFQTVSQYFLLPQDDDHLILLKHVYIMDDKVLGSYVQSLHRGKGKEIAWGNQNKKLVRKAFQRMLEQLGGLQFRKHTLTPEKKEPTSSATVPESDEWQFTQEHGELDKSDLKQLKWIDSSSHQLGRVPDPWLAGTSCSEGS